MKEEIIRIINGEDTPEIKAMRIIILFDQQIINTLKKNTTLSEFVNEIFISI